MKVVIEYFGADKTKPPRIFYLNNELETFLAEIIVLTKKKALFAVYRLGDCVGDYS